MAVELAPESPHVQKIGVTATPPPSPRRGSTRGRPRRPPRRRSPRRPPRRRSRPPPAPMSDGTGRPGRRRRGPPGCLGDRRRRRGGGGGRGDPVGRREGRGRGAQTHPAARRASAEQVVHLPRGEPHADHRGARADRVGVAHQAIAGALGWVVLARPVNRTRRGGRDGVGRDDPGGQQGARRRPRRREGARGSSDGARDGAPAKREVGAPVGATLGTAEHA